MTMRAKLFGTTESATRHRDRFSLRNPWMSAWFVMLILIPFSRVVLFLALAIGVYHVVIGGVADLLRSGGTDASLQGSKAPSGLGRWTWALLLAAGLFAHFAGSPSSLTRIAGDVMLAAGLALGTLRVVRGSHGADRAEPGERVG